MKFLYKILLCTIIIMAAAFGISGYFFVNFVFESALEREVAQALDGSSILRFAFETAALNIPTKYNVLQDAAVMQIGSRLESGGQNTGRCLRLSDEARNSIYASEGFSEDTALLQQIRPETKVWRIASHDGRYYIHTGIVVNALDRELYLETLEDVTEVFDERTTGFLVYRRVTLAMLACSGTVMLLICIWLTKPIRLLANATKHMAAGEYGYRARRVSNDELGQLTTDFNSMANVLEETIGELKDEVRAREDFIAAFAHELKTPLTAIIGYADMLRSRKLDEEKHFLSANYIYTEGKRLENMSFRLMDIIVTRRETLEAQPLEAKALFEYLRGVFAGNKEQKIRMSVQSGTVYGEPNLLKSVLVNLMDNACKASREGGMVKLSGRRMENGYAFEVKDYGVGIPEEELKKVTEAFYMVDKSRSRSRNGAGLGLALCVEILRLHGSELNIQSKVGEGTCVSFVIPGPETGEGLKAAQEAFGTDGEDGTSGNGGSAAAAEEDGSSAAAAAEAADRREASAAEAAADRSEASAAEAADRREASAEAEAADRREASVAEAGERRTR